jgi:hypothetical protein
MTETTTTTTTTTKDTTRGEEAEPERDQEEEAVETIESAETEKANDEPREIPEPPIRDAPSPLVCPSLRHIFMFPEEAMERLARRPASPTSPPPTSPVS